MWDGVSELVTHAYAHAAEVAVDASLPEAGKALRDRYVILMAVEGIDLGAAAQVVVVGQQPLVHAGLFTH